VRAYLVKSLHKWYPEGAQAAGFPTVIGPFVEHQVRLPIPPQIGHKIAVVAPQHLQHLVSV